MGQYLSPDDPNAYEHKCAIIIYPDDEAHFYLQAVRGQLSELARPFVWEGNREKTDAIAQIFTATDLLTDDVFFGLDCELLPVITGDEILNINVNCSCSAGPCGDSGPTTLYCVLPDGTPVVTPQIPPGETPPMYEDVTYPPDPESDPPPPEYNDWAEFDAAACTAANSMVFAARLLLTLAETLADYATALTALLVIIVPFLPASWVAAAGAWSLTEAIRMLVKLFASEQATDVINDLVEWMDGDKGDIVCFIYSHRYDFKAIPAGVMIKAKSYLDSLEYVTDENMNYVQNLITYMFFWTVFYAFAFEKVLDLADVTDPEPYDCEECVITASSGFAFVNVQTNITIVDHLSNPVVNGDELLYGEIYTVTAGPADGADASWWEKVSFGWGDIAGPVYHNTDVEIISSADYTAYDSPNQHPKVLMYDASNQEVLRIEQDGIDSLPAGITEGVGSLIIYGERVEPMFQVVLRFSEA